MNWLCAEAGDCAAVTYVIPDGIIPGLTCNVQAVEMHCELSTEEHFSSPLTMTTSLWGDLVETCAVTPCSPAKGEVGMPTDVTAGLNKFNNLERAPIKARCDPEPDSPDLAVNISDVSAALDAFRGFAYPFDGPQECP